MELYRNHLAPLTWGNVSQVDRSLGVYGHQTQRRSL